MKVEKFISIDSLNGSEKFQFETEIKYKSGPYLVDDSRFSPMSEALKQLNNMRPLSDQEISSCYDFPNGHDSGVRIPLDRMHGFNDITELSHDINVLERELNEVVKHADEVAKLKVKAKTKVTSEVPLSSK